MAMPAHKLEHKPATPQPVWTNHKFLGRRSICLRSANAAAALDQGTWLHVGLRLPCEEFHAQATILSFQIEEQWHRLIEAHC